MSGDEEDPFARRIALIRAELDGTERAYADALARSDDETARRLVLGLDRAWATMTGIDSVSEQRALLLGALAVAAEHCAEVPGLDGSAYVMSHLRVLAPALAERAARAPAPDEDEDGAREQIERVVRTWFARGKGTSTVAALSQLFLTLGLVSPAQKDPDETTRKELARWRAWRRDAEREEQDKLDAALVADPDDHK